MIELALLQACTTTQGQIDPVRRSSNAAATPTMKAMSRTMLMPWARAKINELPSTAIQGPHLLSALARTPRYKNSSPIGVLVSSVTTPY